MAAQGYRHLEVWQKAMAVFTSIYEATNQFPKKEVYALTNQSCRAAASIPSNIVEGKSRYSAKDFIRFLLIARGSVAELETQLLISNNLGYLTDDRLKLIFEDVTEIGGMLRGLIAGLSDKNDYPVAANN